MRWLALMVLLVAVVVSAVGVVVLRHESRQLFIALQSAESERDQANVEWSRLQLEQAWLGDASRIERAARERLNMKSPEETRVIVSHE